MRISSAGTITERLSACSGTALDAGSEVAGAAVVVALSVLVGVAMPVSAAAGGAASATGKSVLIWGTDTGGAIGRGSAGCGVTAVEGPGEELEAIFAGAAGFPDLTIVVVGLRGVLAARLGVDDERALRVVADRRPDAADDRVEDADGDGVEGADDDRVEDADDDGVEDADGDGVEDVDGVSTRAVCAGGVVDRTPRRCRRSPATRVTKSRDSEAG